MKNRLAFIIATILTAFVLVVIGGVIARLSAAPPTPVASPAPAPALDPNTQATIDKLQADYQQAIATLEEANRRLEQANQDRERLTQPITDQPLAATEPLPPVASVVDPVQSPDPPALPATQAPALPPTRAPAPPPTAAPPPPTAAPQRITAERAAAIATAYVGGGTVERVELEEEHGALIYEVRFTNNSRVYVDPYSGQVVYAKLSNKGDGGGGDDNRNDDNSGSGGGDDDRDDDNSGSGKDN